jgi:formylglycine-generating enzyme required for sulfatase activity
LLARTHRHQADLKKAASGLKQAKADWIHDRDLLESAKACLAEKKYGEVESALQRIKRTDWTDLNIKEIQGSLTSKRDSLLKEVESAASDKAAAIRLAQTLVEEYRTSLTIVGALKKRAVELGHELALQQARKRRNRMLFAVSILAVVAAGLWMREERKAALEQAEKERTAAAERAERERTAAAERAERERIAMVEAKERREKAVAGGIRDKEGRLYVSIPEGAFEMGSTTGDADEKPVHSVQVNAFFIAETEVTWGEWMNVLGWAKSHGYEFFEGKGTSDKHPVTDVSWYDCVKWCNAKSEKEGLRACYQVNGGVYRKGDESTVRCEWNANGYRLPTEAEWEKAARGGLVGKAYPHADSLEKKDANFEGSGTVEVGRYAPNGYGLRDMAGNVWEWCWDWYGEYPAGDGAALMNSQGPEQGVRRVLRGGSWDGSAAGCRAAFRGGFGPGFRNYNLGLRPALVPFR